MEKDLWMLWSKAGVLIIYALIGAYGDLKTRTVSLRLSAAAALAGCIFLAAEGRALSWMELVFPFLPGLFLLGTGIVTGGSIGMGDAVFMLVLGVYMSPGEVLGVLTASWLICAVLALGILAVHRWHWRKRSRAMGGIPFVTAALPAVLITAAQWVAG